jgi:XTP/dITP diphosphohydrolase
MQKLLIATGNVGKFSEISAVLEDLSYKLLSLKDLDGVDGQVEEDGTTHEANAFIKARHFFKLTGYMTVGEDSGVQVDALEGELGLHTRRWGAGTEATDEEWLEFFLKRMESFSDEKRGARFLCSAALILPDGTEHFFEGEALGMIVRQPEAPLLPGLPLSSVFRPAGFDRVYADLTKSEKAQISHRGLAIGRVKDFLLDYSVSSVTSSSSP